MDTAVIPIASFEKGQRPQIEDFVKANRMGSDDISPVPPQDWLRKTFEVGPDDTLKVSGRGVSITATARGTDFYAVLKNGGQEENIGNGVGARERLINALVALNPNKFNY